MFDRNGSHEREVVGFVGDDIGMTMAQRSKFFYVLSQLHPQEFHHEDYKGSCIDAHDCAVFRHVAIHVYPLTDDEEGNGSDGSLQKVLPHPQRLMVLLHTCEALIVAPNEMNMRKSSRIRYAATAMKNLGRPVYIIYPDGTIEKEEQNEN